MEQRISRIMRVFRNPARVSTENRIPAPIRRIVMKDYNYTCAGNVPGFPCNYKVLDALEIDHILPKSIRCMHRRSNLQVLCSNCHTLKTKYYDTKLIFLHKNGSLKKRHVRNHINTFLKTNSE